MERPARLLPWLGSDGKSCYLITDDRGGPVSRMADDTEAIQLDMGARLLTHADALLPHTPHSDLRHLAECLTAALRDAVRIAESRQQRLEQPD
ncbi:hypothetical protein [Streptomyces sp. CRN 30]|uniref:hypothetical protein n=1 Tax=Streptomyces sp. CRN 30 TaxID=3075613 RepID=UPI002A829ADC|nr:hypothetical protein [Streptomyces sp. CRN 30]